METVIMNNILEASCYRGQCILKTNVNISKLVLQYPPVSLDSIFSVLQNLAKFTSQLEHVPCLVAVLTVELCRIDDLCNVENFQKVLTAMCKTLCQLPSKHFPLQLKQDSENNAVYNLNEIINPFLTHQCLKMYLQVLFFHTKNFESDNEKFFEVLSSPNKFQKYLVKKTAAVVLLLTSSRLGNYSWTNGKLKALCQHINKVIVSFSAHTSVSSLLSGADNDSKEMLFSSGLLCVVLDELSIHFQKEKFDRNIPWKHALIWCVTKVKFPKLGKHITKIVPVLLSLVDDYNVNNKVFGISTLTYLIENVNPSELNLYNHGKVIYDALFNQLYSNKECIYEITLPCLLKVLYVIDDKPDKLDGVKFTAWDSCVEKIVQNIEFSNHLKTRCVLLKCFPPFLNAVGINIVKHTNNIFKAMTFVLLFSDTEKEATRTFALNVILKTIKNGWPVIPRYKVMLSKCIIKFIIDIKSAGHCAMDLEKQIIEKASQVMVLLRLCCGESFDELLKEAVHSKCESTSVGLFVQGILKNVLEMDLTQYDFTKL